MIELALIGLLIAGPLGYVMGVESRDGYEEHPRSWWAGSRS
jgi:hypothetical protein